MQISDRKKDDCIILFSGMPNPTLKLFVLRIHSKMTSQSVQNHYILLSASHELNHGIWVSCAFTDMFDFLALSVLFSQRPELELTWSIPLALVKQLHKNMNVHVIK